MRPYYTHLLHIVDHPARSRVAYLKTALEHGCRSLSALDNETDGLLHHRVDLRSVAGRNTAVLALAVIQLFGCDLANLLFDLLVILGCMRLFDEVGHALDLIIASKAALYADRLRRSYGRIQQVAPTYELLCSACIEDSTRIYL